MKHVFCSCVLSAAVSATLGLSAFASNDELPDTFGPETGYVRQLVKDTTGGAAHPSFITNNVGSTETYGSWEEAALNPHAGTNYCVSTYSKGGTIVTPDVSGLSSTTTWTFAGDKLVVDCKDVQNMSTGKNYPYIPELYMVNGSRFNWYNTKNVLTGNCHIRRSTTDAYETRGGPVRFYSNSNLTGNNAQPFGMVVDGDADQKVVVMTSKNNNEGRSSHFMMTASWADYHGTILVTNNCFEYGLSGYTQLSMTGPEVPARVTVTTNCLFASLTPDMNLVGLTVRTHRSFNIAAGGTWKVGDLRLDRTMRIDFASEASRLVVTNSLTRAPGAGFLLVLPTLSTAAQPAADLPLVTFEPEVDLGNLSPADFTISGITASETGLPTYTYTLDFEPGAQGRTQLVLHRNAVITLNGSAKSVQSGKNLWYDEADADGKYYWSDSNVVHGVADYLIREGSSSVPLPKKANACVEGSATENAYVFPGDSLTLQLGNATYSVSDVAVSILDFKKLFVRANTALRTFGTHTKIDGLDTLRFLAPISIDGGVLLTSTPYNSKNQRYEGEVSGAGNIELSSYRGAKAEATNQGSSEFLGTNVSFTGQIRFNHDYYTKVDGDVTKYTIPNDRVYCKLFTRDGRSLGGPLASFDYDSLWLRHWGCFIPRESVTLDQANRGVYVSDVGQIQLDAGVKLTIRNPLTMKGTLRVRTASANGGGTLALGGPLRFAANNTLADLGSPEPAGAPTNNVMIVSNVCVQALATNAFDGAALTLAGAKAGIVVDPLATGDLAAFGLVNLRGTVVADNGDGDTSDDTIAVRIDNVDKLTDAGSAPAICTVPKKSPLTVRSFGVINRPSGFSAAVTCETDDAADTKTFRLTLVRKGVILLVR